MKLFDIYLEFLIIGFQLLGGGYVIVPLMRERLVENKKWITEQNLIDFYALSQSVPGLIALNISMFTGYLLRGKSGAFVALLGIVTSPIISILLIASIVDLIINFSFIKTVFWGAGIAVIILIFLTIKEMWKLSISDVPSGILFVLCFLLSFIFGISPVYIIILAIIYGIFINKIRRNNDNY
jgi:chromate transporter